MLLILEILDLTILCLAILDLTIWELTFLDLKFLGFDLESIMMNSIPSAFQAAPLYSKRKKHLSQSQEEWRRLESMTGHAREVAQRAEIAWSLSRHFGPEMAPLLHWSGSAVWQSSP